MKKTFPIYIVEGMKFLKLRFARAAARGVKAVTDRRPEIQVIDVPRSIKPRSLKAGAK